MATTAIDTALRHRPGTARRVGTAVAPALLMLAFLLIPTSAHAATMTVASGLVHISDDGQCSLREAIANAEADSQVHADCPAGAGADVITLPGGTYLLNSGRAGAPESAFTIMTDVTLVGSGSVARAGGEATVLDAGGAFRHFDVDDDARLHLEALHLTNGSADEGGAVRAGRAIGGGLIDGASFSATDVRFTSNEADSGGAVWAGLTDTTLTDSVLTDNQATHGAAATIQGGTFTLVDSLVSLNHAEHGVVVVHTAARARVVGSAIRDNTGIGLVNRVAELTVERSTVSGNDGLLAGGLHAQATRTCGFHGCSLSPATTTIRDATFSGNTSSQGSGAIWSSDLTDPESDPPYSTSYPAELTLTNVTVSGNYSPGGGQVRASGPTVRNTVIADAAGGVNCDVTDDVYDGELWSGSHNVSDDASCSSGGFTQAADALLGPLAFNGGPTATHLPHPASPLIDAGHQATCDEGRRIGGGTDQRGVGFPRTVGDACDIGAVEADAPVLLPVLAADVEGLVFRGGPGQRHEGLRNSLLAKLGAASDAVDRGDYGGATGPLGAFHEQVEAQAGGPIMEHDAARLTTAALVIIDLFPEGWSWRPQDS